MRAALGGIEKTRHTRLQVGRQRETSLASVSPTCCVAHQSALEKTFLAASHAWT